MQYLIGVDIGTQGTKAVAITSTGQIVAAAYSGYNVSTPRPLWAEQWPDPWVEAVIKTINEVITKGDLDPDKVAGVAISSLYGGSGIPVDQEVKPLAPCLIWMDRRADKEVEWVKGNLDLERLFQITGNWVDSYYGFTKMLWIKNNWPAVWEKISLFMPPNSYVIYKLTGEIAVDYSSAGNIGGVFDINEKKWSSEMMELLGIPSEFQPERLVSSSEIVGKISEKAARETGLKAGTPVISGGIDAAVATLSAGAFDEGYHVAMMGTSMCWGFITARNNLSPKLVSMPYVVEPLKKTYTFGGAATAGAVVRWFRDNLAGLELEAEQKMGIDAYSLLELKAIDIPAGSEGILVLPYFMGERSPIWNSDARGTIMGLSLFHTKAHLYKAFMEGVAYALRHNMEAVEDTDLKLDEEIVLTGGATKSMIWPQIFADVTGYPVKMVRDDVEAPLGDALLAGLGSGVIEDPEVLKDWLEYDRVLYPDPKNNELYDQYYYQYVSLYDNIKGNMKAVNDIS